MIKSSTLGLTVIALGVKNFAQAEMNRSNLGHTENVLFFIYLLYR